MRHDFAMFRIPLAVLLLVAALPVQAAAVPAQAETAVKSAWVQYGPGGVLEARAVVAGDACPGIVFDLKPAVMQKRAAASAEFPTLCAAAIPPGTKLAALAEPLMALPLPAGDPTRIVVFGDSGCRIKGELLQDCRDPQKWPFARIAAEAARLKPDLVLHLGDFVSREAPCPANAASCTGMPYGDAWEAWAADFFDPAAPLLAAAPLVIVRGNHEVCSREGAGWLRLFGPQAYDPAAPCSDHVAAYSIALAKQSLVVMDDSAAPETSVAEEQVPVLQQELAALSQAPAWLLMHRPIWAAITGPLGLPVGGSQTMIAAAGTSGIPVSLMLSGHIHTFEAINYNPDNHVPPQIVAGTGGDLLTPAPSNLRGTIFQGSSGVRVRDGISQDGFGFLLMTRNGDAWRIDLYDPQGLIVRTCNFRSGRVDCPVRRNGRR
jgi:hypothetical protein